MSHRPALVARRARVQCWPTSFSTKTKPAVSAASPRRARSARKRLRTPIQRSAALRTRSVRLRPCRALAAECRCLPLDRRPSYNRSTGTAGCGTARPALRRATFSWTMASTTLTLPRWSCCGWRKTSWRCDRAPRPETPSVAAALNACWWCSGLWLVWLRLNAGTSFLQLTWLHWNSELKNSRILMTTLFQE